MSASERIGPGVRLQRRTVRPLRRSAVPPLTTRRSGRCGGRSGGPRSSVSPCCGSAVLRRAWCDRLDGAVGVRPADGASVYGRAAVGGTNRQSGDRTSCRSTVAPPAVVRLTVVPDRAADNAAAHEASAHGRAGGHGAATSGSEDTPVHCRLTGAGSRRPTGDESEPVAKVPPMRVGPWALLLDPADAGHRGPDLHRQRPDSAARRAPRPLAPFKSFGRPT
jgi:hypothetical protein